jgi:hypothetical protein
MQRMKMKKNLINTQIYKPYHLLFKEHNKRIETELKIKQK